VVPVGLEPDPSDCLQLRFLVSHKIGPGGSRKLTHSMNSETAGSHHGIVSDQPAMMMMACHNTFGGQNFTKSLCDSDQDDEESTDCEASSDADTANHIVGTSLASDKRDANIDPLISDVTVYRPLAAADDDDTRLISMASQIDDIDISQDLKYFHDFLSMSFEFVDDDEPRSSMEGTAAVDCTPIGGFIEGLWPFFFIGAPTDETSVGK
jgi:hypothetical protein